MADKGALKPEIFNIPSFIREEKDEEALTAEEKILAAGADTSFWKTLRRNFENAIETLDQINESAMANGMPVEEIGRNAIVISQVKGVLRKIVDQVQDAKEALENERGEGK